MLIKEKRIWDAAFEVVKLLDGFTIVEAREALQDAESIICSAQKFDANGRGVTAAFEEFQQNAAE